MAGDALRMNRLTPVSPAAMPSEFHSEKGVIVVSREVITSRDRESFGVDREEGNSSDRTDSLKSLVVKEDLSRDWRQQ